MLVSILRLALALNFIVHTFFSVRSGGEVNNRGEVMSRLLLNSACLLLNAFLKTMMMTMMMMRGGPLTLSEIGMHIIEYNPKDDDDDDDEAGGEGTL